MIRRPSEQPPLAIIGMACRLPGADNLDEFWNLLRSGGSGIGEIPPQRLDRELYYHPAKGRLNKTYSCLGGLVSSRPLDRAACPLTDQQIATADVAHLTLCEVAAAACRDAGLDPFDLPLRNTGVYVGHTAASPLAAQVAYHSNVAEMALLLRQVEPFGSLPTAEREDLIKEIIAAVRREPLATQAGGKLELSSLAAAKLISRGFGLTGPFLVVDAACASSLQALALAAAALQQGRIDMAIVGGASYCKSDTLVLFSHAQSLSARGSRPFAADADGLILAEGYVSLVLKTCDRALADGDKILAVIRGIGMSTDGRGKSLWAPRKEGQILAIQRAYEPAVDVARLQYLEAHATSTQIGDATELQALAEALGQRLPPGHKIPIGSVKANVGHTLEAAGLTGLVKTVLAMRHQVIPPAINCPRLNPEIDWTRAPFFVPTSDLAWPKPTDGFPRRAAVNSFGIGGLNVHVVLDEHLESPARPTSADGSGGKAHRPDGSDRDAVAIVGVGCLLPGARTVAAFWDLLSQGRDAKGPLPAGRWNPAAGVDCRTGKSFEENSPRGGFITDYAYDWRRHVVPPKQVEQANPLQFMLLDATEQALHDAGYDHRPLDRNRVGVVVGSMFGDEFSQQLNMALRLPQFRRTMSELLIGHGFPAGDIERVADRFEKLLIERMPALVDETGSFTSSTLASRITKSFDLFGGGLALDAGEAAGLAALAASVDLLRSGSCDMIVCAAGDRNMGLLVYEAEALRGRLAQGQTHSPFDAQSGGSLPGEGVGVVLLKRLADARRDGDPIRGIVRGVGAASGDDLYQATRLAMRRALRDATVEPQQVAALEMTSAGTPAAEERQAAAVEETYCCGPRANPLRLGSLANQIGNTRAASGMAALIKSTLAIEHGEMPAEVGLEQAASWIADKPKQITASGRRTPLLPDNTGGPLVAAVTASTDDCLAYHVILERGVPMPSVEVQSSVIVQSTERPESRSEWHIVRLTAGNVADLAAKAGAAAPDALSLLSKSAGTTFPADAAWRLALVVDSAESLATKLRLAAEQLALPQSRVALEEQGIYCHARRETAGQVAFVFPGQGSQYAGMLGDLVRQNKSAAAAVREVDAALVLLGYPSFDEISTDADQMLGADVLRTQLSMLLADVIVFRTLTSLGIRPDVVSGHSYGEFAALTCAGAWSLEQAIGATAARCQAIDRGCPLMPTQMLSVAAPENVVRPHVAARGDVFLSHRNAPDQTVVAGEAGAVQTIAARLRSAGFESRPLPVPRAFHTPLLAGAQALFAAAVEKTWIVPPQIPLLSSVSGRLVSDPAEIRANLVAQLTTPVDYVALVEQLSQSGVAVLIEVGPQQILTRLNRRIVGDAAVCIASDHPKRSSEQQICRLLAQLETVGVRREAVAPAGRSKPAVTGLTDSGSLSNNFVNLDATTRRKARLRCEPNGNAPNIARQPPATTDRASNQPPAAPGIRSPQGGAEPPAFGAVPKTIPESAPSASLAAVNDNGGSSPVRWLSNAPLLSELESFLVQFVVDQTGYPPEIVKLDADLEADLGIDSIKKAQLFGELREYFDVTPSDDLRLDQFPTLRHVLDFLKGVPGKAQWLDDTAPATGEPALAENSNSSAQLAVGVAMGNGMVAGVTSAPVALVAAPTVTSLLWTATAPAAPSSDRPDRPKVTVRPKANAPQIEQLEQFLVQFVIDQTGYPPEIVKLDADLEADLGIDTIKKAQLFGELGEFFDVSSPENLRIDAFPTLGHVLELLRSALDEQPVALATAVPISPGIAAEPITLPAEPPVLEEPPVADLPIRLCGLNYERAREYGNAQRLPIRRWLKRQAEKTTIRAVQAADVARFLPQPEQFFSTAELEELRGIADGAGVLTANLIAHHLSQARLGQRQESGSTATSQEAVPGAGASAVVGDPSSLTQRLVLRMMDAPLRTLPLGAKFVPAGAALVLGDNALASAIAARLSTLGVPVEVVSSSHSWSQVRQQFETFWARQPVHHLFLTTAHDPEARLVAGEAAWQRRYERGVLTPFFLCQEWLARLEDARLCQSATLVAATALGADFGFSGNPSTIEGGAASGLIKSLFIESHYEKWTGLRFKVVDFEGSEPTDAAAAAVFEELASGEPDIEVGYRAGRRRVVRAVPQPVGAPRPESLPSGTWVVTGGGRGITAIAAMALARRFKLKLHLVGLSPRPDVDPSWRGLSPSGLEELRKSVIRRAHAAGLPPLEEWSRVEKALEIDRTIKACADAGIAATYHSCDVSVWEDLEKVLEQIREIDGPIEGVLHGAGIVRDAAFRRKKPANVQRTFAAKAGSASALIELTRQDPLRHFVAFSSVSGRFGMTGQADYASANELLSKQIDRLRQMRPECSSLAIHWHAWDETGLANRPELQATFAALEIKFMPPTEGVNHLIRELECGISESEIVFTSIDMCRKQYPLACIAQADELDGPDTKVAIANSAAANGHAMTAAAPKPKPAPTTGQPAACPAPLVAAVTEHRAGQRLTAEIRLDPAGDPFLSEHLLGGKPLLPFVMGVESVAQTARILGSGIVTTIEDVQVHNGLGLPDGQPKTVHVDAEKLPGGKYCSRLTTEFRDREGRLVDPARLCVEAHVDCGAALEPLDVAPSGEPPLGWFPMFYPDDAPIFHGPKFRCLKQVAIQYDGAFGRIVAPPPEELGGTRTKAGWILPAAALDGCLMLCSTFAYFQFSKRAEIPIRLARLQLGRLPRAGESCLVRMFFKGQDARSARYDFHLYGDNGDCLLSAVGYQTTVLSGAMT